MPSEPRPMSARACFLPPVPSIRPPLQEPCFVAIQTERFRMHPLLVENVQERHVGWMNDPEVVLYLDSRYSPQDMESVRRFVAGMDHRRSFIWAIHERDNDEYIGNCTLFVDWTNSLAELGVLIGEKKFWGQNTVLETYTALILLSFFHFNLYKIWAKTRSSNYRAVWNLRKLGMRFEAELPDHVIFGERRVGLVYFGLTRSEWIKTHGVTPIA